MFLGHLGTQRAILVDTDGTYRRITDDHVLTNCDEFRRISSIDRSVIKSDRVGDVSVTRGLGYFAHKSEAKPADQQVISCVPDVCEVTIKPNHMFIVIVSDGVTNTYANDRLVKFIRQQLTNGTNGLNICKKVLEKCIAEKFDQNTATSLKGSDNSSIILFDLRGMKEEMDRKAENKRQEREDKKKQKKTKVE